MCPNKTTPRKKAIKKKSVSKAKISSKKVTKKPTTKSTTKKVTKKPTTKSTTKKVTKKITKKPTTKSTTKKVTKKTTKKTTTNTTETITPSTVEKPIKKKSNTPKRISKGEIRKRKLKRRDILKNVVVRQHLINTAGEHALEVVQDFTDLMTDEEISRRLKVKVSEIRATLNKLHYDGLVRYSRSKDPETGWYSYLWRINEDKVHKLTNLENTYNKLQDKINNTELYYCEDCSCDEVFNFEKSIDLKFKCPYCTSSLKYLEKEYRDALIV